MFRTKSFVGKHSLKGWLSAASVVLTLIFTTALPEGAMATSLPVASGSHLYVINYTGGGLSEITGTDSSGFFTTTSICATVCANPDGASGAYYDRSSGSIKYLGVGTGRSGLYSVPVAGTTAGSAAALQSDIGYDGYSLASDSNGIVYTVTNGGELRNIDVSTGTVGNSLGTLTAEPANTWNGFAFNPVDGQLYGMTRSSAILYQINTTTGVATPMGTVSGITESYSLQVDSAGIFWVLDGSNDLYTFSLSGSAMSAPTHVGKFANWTTTALVMDSPPLTKTVTFSSNGGSGTQASQSSSTSAVLPSTTTFTAPTGKRFRGWFDASLGGSYISTFDFSTDKTVYAYWTGGPLTFSLTSGGQAEASVALADTVVGATSTTTVYVKNSSATSSTALGNINGPNLNGLTASNSGTCHTNNTLAALAECTVILSWTPSASGNIVSGTALSIQSTGTYTEAVTLTGAAVTTRTVTFYKNDSSGTNVTQVGYATQPLTANNWTRAGYSFSGWASAADGTGTTYSDGGTYNFAGNLNLYAQWSAIPVVTAPVAPAEPSGPQIIASSQRVFIEGSSQVLTIEGKRFEEVSINGKAIKVIESGSESIKLDLGGLQEGTFSISFKFKVGSLTYQDAITIKAKVKDAESQTVPSSASKLISGFAGDRSRLTPGLKIAIAALLKQIPNATFVVCTGSTSNIKATPSDFLLARARASAACAYAKMLLPGLKASIKLNPASSSAPSARNVLMRISH